MPHLDIVHRLNEAIQAVRRVAAEFPPGRREAALVAAARVLLDRVPGLAYRVWPEDEPLLRTLDAKAADLVATAEQVAMLRDHGDAHVLRVLQKLVADLGYTLTNDDIDAPF